MLSQVHSSSFCGVVLAAGKGVRMKSRKPKILHEVLGVPMVAHVVRVLEVLGAEKNYVVVSPGDHDAVREVLGEKVNLIIQREQFGTGHALLQTEKALSGYNGVLLVLYGDTPLVTQELLQGLLSHHRKEKAQATVLTAELSNPTGYGRVVRKRQQFQSVVEERDATEEEKRITEINTGMYCMESPLIFRHLPSLTQDNAQNECYLPPVLEYLVSHGYKVSTYKTNTPDLILGVNTRQELALVTQRMAERIRNYHMLQGVTLLDPASTFIEPDVVIGEDTVILPNTSLGRGTRIGRDCRVGPSTCLVNTIVEDSAVIQFTVADNAVIGSGSSVGPFAYLRPSSNIGKKVKIGNFVEIKNSTIGNESKVPHLSYIGDAEIGKHVNIGAGTITCNYDGKGKYKTIIEDQAFIGSNSNLVAPVRVGTGAITGAGAVVTKDVEPHTVVVGVPAKPLRKQEGEPENARRENLTGNIGKKS